MSKSIYFILIITLFSATNVFGQVSNDDCRLATFIDDITDYCSQPGEFTTVNSTASPDNLPACWPQNTAGNDVWIAFKPKNLEVNIRLIGRGSQTVETLVRPQIVVYRGPCANLVEVGCASDLFAENREELTITNLSIGQTYYVRIAARDANVGRFSICISNYAPQKAPESDCSDAVVLCSKDPFFVEFLSGVGTDRNEVAGTCIQEELASVWYKWVCKDAGTLTFTLTPNSPGDDLDFAVFELPGGANDCNNKQLVRCMAAGETIGNSPAQNAPCFGPTGLNLTSRDFTEQPGCQGGNDNFVAALNMEPGKAYALIINNFSTSGFGFSVEFGGTGTFLGPEPDFDVEALELFTCDKTIRFFENSNNGPDSIISKIWNFGEGSTPSSFSGNAPVDVVYASFGDKTAALTVETLRGCIVTKTTDFFVQACCQDTSTLSVEAVKTDPTCAYVDDGTIRVIGTSGNPEYEYKLQNRQFTPREIFTDLGEGSYTIILQDSKGCVDTTTVQINAPLPFEVNAGADVTIPLGESTMLDGSVSPFNNYTYEWIVLNQSEDNSLSDYTVLDPLSMPCVTTTYLLNAYNPAGCVYSDTITVVVENTASVTAPNIMRPEISNDRFTLFGDHSALEQVQNLMIFDRWGNKVFEANNIDLNNAALGWDGFINGQSAMQGVYTWLAHIQLVCGFKMRVDGDVTILK